MTNWPLLQPSGLPIKHGVSEKAEMHEIDAEVGNDRCRQPTEAKGKAITNARQASEHDPLPTAAEMRQTEQQRCAAERQCAPITQRLEQPLQAALNISAKQQFLVRVTNNRLFASHSELFAGQVGSQPISPKAIAVLKQTNAVPGSVNAVIFTTCPMATLRSAQGQASRIQNPISGLSRFRYMENGADCGVRRCAAITRSLKKPGSQWLASANASAINRQWPKPITARCLNCVTQIPAMINSAKVTTTGRLK